MKKILLIAILFSLVLVPFLTNAAGLVPCGNTTGDPCTISDFFTLLGNIYNFIVKYIATPLATLALLIGGIMMILSAGNPSLMAKGKQVIFLAIIGLVLTFGSWLIIKALLSAMGYKYGF